jgi:hypothetical protein
MRKFGAYPVVVNFNLHMQLRSDYKGKELYQAGRREEERQLFITTTTTSDSTIQNNMWKQEIDQWETTVCQCLRKIEGNPVGRMVLGLINKQTKVWIIPETDDWKKCSCAQTFPLNYEIQPGSVARGAGSGDTVIEFTPELGDDTLFHELVHAYRYSYKKFSPMCLDIQTPKGPACGSSEEFLAHQMTNIYMSQANRPLTLDYYDSSVALKDEIYEYLQDHVDRLEAVKYFLRHEYLAMLAAHTFTAVDCNPFRDYAMLEAKLLKDFEIDALPELGAATGR